MRALKTATLLLMLLVNAFALLWLVAPRVSPAAGVPVSQDNGDIDGDGLRNITDAVRLLQFLFQDGPPPVPVACAEGGPELGEEILAKLDSVVAAVENPCRDRIDRMVIHGDGTLTDRCTGLMWRDTTFPDADEGDPRPGLYCEEALALADAHEAAGYDDWRVPTVREMRTLLDWRQRANVASGWMQEFPTRPGVFSSDRYWTSELLAPDTDSAWALNFRNTGPQDAYTSPEGTTREQLRSFLVRGSLAD